MPRNRLQAGTDCRPEPIDWFQEPTMKAKIEILKEPAVPVDPEDWDL